MSEYVELSLRRNRGWPWPEASSGLGPMYGIDGWCHSCGVPKREQTGSLILQRKGFKTVEGGWVPNWRFDVFCVDALLAEEAVSQFGVSLRPVVWHGDPPGDAAQVDITPTRARWFEPAALEAIFSRIEDGTAGSACADCGVWRWMPIGMGDLMMPSSEATAGNPPVIASPEWFGDGKQSFRQVLWREDLAEMLATASPKDFRSKAVGSA